MVASLTGQHPLLYDNCLAVLHPTVVEAIVINTIQIIALMIIVMMAIAVVVVATVSVIIIDDPDCTAEAIITAAYGEEE